MISFGTRGLKNALSQNPLLVRLSVALILCCALGGGWYLYMVSSVTPIERMQRCGGYPTNAWSRCVEAIVSSSVGSHVSAQSFLQDASLSFPRSQCHIIGHMVGKRLYELTPSLEKGLTQCSSVCSFACGHGVIGEFFSQHTAFPNYTDLATIDRDVLRAQGKKLCDEDRELCHAVGHVVYRVFNSLKPALALCDSLRAKNIRSCYGGVFMEYNIVAVSLLQSTAPTSSDMVRNRSASLLSPCDTMESKYQVACYEYLFLRQDVRFDYQRVKYELRPPIQFAACARLPQGENRNACMHGTGLDLTEHMQNEDVQKMCESLPLESDQLSCVEGYAHGMALYTHFAEVENFCHLLGTASHKQSCYDGLFFALTPKDSVKPLEKACEFRNDIECQNALSDFRSSKITAPILF